MQLLRLVFHGVALTIQSEASEAGVNGIGKDGKISFGAIKVMEQTFNTQFLAYERQ